MNHAIKATIRRLKAKGAPNILVQLASGIAAPGALKFEFQNPKEFYCLVSDHPGGMPFEDKLLPLWETNGDSITALVDGPKPMVIRYYYGDPADKYEVVGHSIMEAIDHRLRWLLSECERNPEEILAAARACEHPSPEQLVEGK